MSCCSFSSIVCFLSWLVEDEVAGTGHRIVVSDHGVTLDGARAPVVQVILGDLPPTEESQHEVPQRQHGEHTQAKIQHPVPPRARTVTRSLSFPPPGNVLMVLLPGLVLHGERLRSPALRLVLGVVPGLSHAWLRQTGWQ